VETPAADTEEHTVDESNSAADDKTADQVCTVHSPLCVLQGM